MNEKHIKWKWIVIGFLLHEILIWILMSISTMIDKI